MNVTTLLLISAQVFLAIAGRSRGNKEPEITSIACNDPAAEAAADLSLRQLNANRREGSVLGLKRISNVQQQFDEENGFVFYLTLDVLETKCHVLSRQLWKDCGAKPRHEAVFGQCKVIFHLNKPKRIAFLQNYDCTLSPAARDGFGCAGCHFSIPLNDSNIEKVAEMSLEKFNKESDYNKYFVLGNITKGARQVVAGTAYHVEFTIHESICNKSAEDFALCDPLDCEFAHSGYCQGMAVWSIPSQDNVNNVKCEIFEPEAAVVEEQKHNEGHPTDQPINDKKDHEKHGDRGRGKKHGHRRGHGHAKHGDKHWHKHDHKHDHNHDSGSHEHDHEHLHNYEHHHSQPQRSRGPPFHPPKTLGTITYLSENEKTTTDSPVEQEKKGKGRKPDRKWEGRPSKSFIRPFPEKASTSDQCPGPAMTLPVTENFPSIGGTQEPTRLPK